MTDLISTELVAATVGLLPFVPCTLRTVLETMKIPRVHFDPDIPLQRVDEPVVI